MYFKKQVSIRWGIVDLLAILGIAFALFYLFTDYEDLANWYLQKNPCFYRSASWTQSFFTPEVKKAGNLFALLLIFSCLIASYLSRKLELHVWSSVRAFLSTALSGRANRQALLLITLYATAVWVWGLRLIPYANDEVFSALNFANQSAWQIVSYYPLPNNHIFFNLLNHFVSGLSIDPVMSGKVISLFFYILLVFGNYLFLKRFIAGKWLLVPVLLVLSLQFMVWGFGHQARGYALYTFSGWLAFVTFYLYQLEHKDKLLVLNMLANIIGIWTIPSFLYFILFQGLAMMVFNVREQRINFRYWYFFLLTGLAIYIAYTPVLLFSGIRSLAGNGYVRPETMSTLELLRFFESCHTAYIQQCFGFACDIAWLRLLIFAFPVVLIFSIDKKIRLLGWLYLLLGFATIGAIVVMNRFPFNRNFSGHFHIALLLALLAIYHFSAVFSRPVVRHAYLIIFSCFCLCWVVNWFRFDQRAVNEQLYYYDIKGFNRKLSESDYTFDQVKSVYLSEESFQWYYILKASHQQLQVDRNACHFDMQDVCIIFKRDSLPRPEAYRLVIKEWDDYNIYEKKKDTGEKPIEK